MHALQSHTVYWGLDYSCTGNSFCNLGKNQYFSLSTYKMKIITVTIS